MDFLFGEHHGLSEADLLKMPPVKQPWCRLKLAELMDAADPNSLVPSAFAASHAARVVRDQRDQDAPEPKKRRITREQFSALTFTAARQVLADLPPNMLAAIRQSTDFFPSGEHHG